MAEAIAAQVERVAEAATAERRAAAKAIALEDAAKLPELKKLAATIDANLESAAVAFATLRTELRTVISRNGIKAPNHDLVRVHTARALQSTKIARLLEVSPLPPNQRIDFAPLVQSWILAIRSHLTRIADGKVMPRVDGHADASEDGREEVLGADVPSEPDSAVLASPKPRQTDIEGAGSAPGTEAYFLEQARIAVQTGSTQYTKSFFYGAIMKIGQRLAQPGDSADTIRQKAMATDEASLLWRAHEIAGDLPPKT